MALLAVLLLVGISSRSYCRRNKPEKTPTSSNLILPVLLAPSLKRKEVSGLVSFGSGFSHFKSFSRCVLERY